MSMEVGKSSVLLLYVSLPFLPLCYSSDHHSNTYPPPRMSFQRSLRVYQSCSSLPFSRCTISPPPSESVTSAQNTKHMRYWGALKPLWDIIGVRSKRGRCWVYLLPCYYGITSEAVISPPLCLFLYYILLLIFKWPCFAIWFKFLSKVFFCHCILFCLLKKWTILMNQLLLLASY